MASCRKNKTLLNSDAPESARDPSKVGLNRRIEPGRPLPLALSVAQSIRQHSLFWLVAANSVGVLLALDLLWPELGDHLAPLTYGRWIPLHLNWQLYGWCSLPLVGVLLHWIGLEPNMSAFRLNRLAIWAWTLALGAGGISWLAGVTSGKIFLDWHGWARPLLPAAMTLLWLTLAWQFWSQRRTLNPGQHALQGFLLLALFCVPPAIFWASGRTVYPSVNPDSGGPTGASLLASSLGIIAVYGLLPTMLRQPIRSTTPITRRVFWFGLALSSGVCLIVNHGHASHHSSGQILSLSLLLGWLPLTWFYFRSFVWSSAAQRWLAAAFAWWVVLVISGFLFFLPGISERLKFTDALVAHAHLALAGLVTCFNLAVLNLLNPGRPITRGFGFWQFALALHIAALACLGWAESADPGALFLSSGWTQAFYGLRLAAGLIMWALSAVWFLNRPQQPVDND